MSTDTLAEALIEAARSPQAACSECGAALPATTASGCCSAKCRAAKSRRRQREACQVALAEISAALAKLSKSLE